MIRKATLLLMLLYIPDLVFGFARFGDREKQEFSPVRQETIAIPVVLDEVANVEIDIYSSDDDLIRTLAAADALAPGRHELIWDGKDQDGDLVPDEVYVPVLRAEGPDGRTVALDPRETTGGEIVDDIDVQITARKDISYVLPGPSRVLVRAGIKGGPMMRSLAYWEPRAGGKNVQRWDGMDESQVVDLREQDGLSLLVTAFRLPAHAIIATGNRAIDYATYRKANGWPDRERAPDSMPLVRDGKRIARQYYGSPTRAREPAVELVFVSQDGQTAEAPELDVGSQVRARVTIDEADRWLLDRSLYEVAFFIDFQFVSEEEQGYLPLTWLWTVDKMPPGEHVFTVNISAFDGKVGVVSRRFLVKE